MNLSRVSKYSVVIRNRNEERYIGHCIQSVVDFLGDDVQIIIVDNESTDESIRIVNTFDYLDINHIFLDKEEARKFSKIENEYLIDYSYEDSFSDISDCESPEPCLYDDMDGNEEYEVNSDNEWVTA